MLCTFEKYRFKKKNIDSNIFAAYGVKGRSVYYSAIYIIA